MDLAIRQARRAEQDNEVPVGAVLLDSDGTLISQGCNNVITRHDPTAHAEILAIRRGGQAKGNYRIPGSILIVTLEPCIMCLGAIIQARIATVVYGASDPKAGAIASQMHGAELPWSNHGFQVIDGIKAEQCSSLLTNFFQQRRHLHAMRRQHTSAQAFRNGLNTIQQGHHGTATHPVPTER
ncbi:MAG: tRNA-specific adenosine deaminase [Deltaproteobacteria bacterium]|nr:MAG: tRNA-specific adenosine deaminase [Deltaproteobacteria bacterium]